MSVRDSPGRRAELILQVGTLRCPQDKECQEFGRGWSAPEDHRFQSNSQSLSPGVLQTHKDLTPHAQGPERSSRVADFSHFYTRGNQGPKRVSGLPEAWNSQRPPPVVGGSQLLCGFVFESSANPSRHSLNATSQGGHCQPLCRGPFHEPSSLLREASHIFPETSPFTSAPLVGHQPPLFCCSSLVLRAWNGGAEKRMCESLSKA